MCKEKEAITKPVQRKSTRVEEENKVSYKNRAKKTTSGLRKKRKTLRISSSSEFDEETSNRLV